MKKWLLLTLLAALPTASALTLTGADGVKADVKDTRRVVVLGKELAETVAALGKTSTLVARDLSSVYPSAMNNVPNLGYIFNVTVEGTLSKKPSLILADTLVSKETVGGWRVAGVPVLVLKTPESPAEVRGMIATLGQVYGAQARAGRLTAVLDRDLGAAQSLMKQDSKGQPHPKTLTLIANGDSLGYAAPKHPLIPFVKLLGLTPVGASDFVNGINEGVVTAAPELLLFVNRAQGKIGDVGGPDKVLADTILSGTPAGRSKRLVQLDEHDFTFGPDLGKGLLKATRLVYH